MDEPHAFTLARKAGFRYSEDWKSSLFVKEVGRLRFAISDVRDMDYTPNVDFPVCLSVFHTGDDGQEEGEQGLGHFLGQVHLTYFSDALEAADLIVSVGHYLMERLAVGTIRELGERKKRHGD